MLTLATGSREPLVSAPGRPGFVEELAREALRRVGLGLQVAQLPHERALANANAGIEDGDLFRAAGFERDYPNLVQVPQPLMDQDFVGLTRRADIHVRGWDDLSDLSVAFVIGNKIIERGLAGHRDLTTVRTNELLIGLLAAGRADVVIINRWVGLHVARRAGVTVRTLEPPLIRVPMFMYLHRRHDALVKPLAAALDQMHRDGTWLRLHDQFLKPLEAAQ
ncbi:MAG: transporter substrate-binding domain-containing protein [Aquincola sp.]|nr:transporter substrate-binding domain-containing protein [Aquincola sp.]